MNRTRYALLAILAWSFVHGALAQQQPTKRGEEEMEEDRPAVIGELAPPIRVQAQNAPKGKAEDLIAKYRQHVIVLYFFRSSDPTSQDLLPAVMKVQNELGPKGLKVFLLTDEKKERVEAFLKDKEFSGEYLFNVYLPYPYNVPAVPRAYIIDPSGILVNHFHPADHFEDRVREQLAKTPPPGADTPALEARLGKASEALEAKKIGRAYTLAKAVESIAAKGSPLADNAKKLVERIEGAAKNWIADARTMINDKKYDDAVKIVAEVSIRFSGAKVADEAGIEISRLTGDRDAKLKIRKALENAKAELVLDQAAEHEAAGRYAEALRMHRDVLNRYTDTDAAKTAEEAIDRINNDPRAQTEIAAQRAEDEAQRWFDIGERFAKVGMYGKAREYFELVREKHPRSRAAPEAVKRLKDLPEPEPSENSDEKDAERDAEKTPG